MKKFMMSLCVVLMVISLCVSRGYSQDKPSEEMMKGIILQFVVWSLNNKYISPPNVSNLYYYSFQITNSFFKNGSDGRDRYCVEINYDVHYVFYRWVPDGRPIIPQKKNMTATVEKNVFLKKDKTWYNNKG